MMVEGKLVKSKESKEVFIKIVEKWATARW